MPGSLGRTNLTACPWLAEIRLTSRRIVWTMLMTVERPSLLCRARKPELMKLDCRYADCGSTGFQHLQFASDRGDCGQRFNIGLREAHGFCSAHDFPIFHKERAVACHSRYNNVARVDR